MWGLQTSARQARRLVLQERDFLDIHRGYFQLYASSRHIRTMYKSCSDVQAKEITKEISFWPFCMKSLRKAAYRQFALCRHGKLGKGNGHVMLSCVVLQIFFEYLITLTPTPWLCVTRKKIGHVTGYLIEGYSLCNLHFQVSPITNPSCEAQFKAAYRTCKLKFASSRFNKSWLV